MNNVLSNSCMHKCKINSFDNLIIIYGPFQLLNAIEAINEFNLKEILLIVMINKVEKSNLQVENYISEHKQLFSQVERLEFSSGFHKYIEYFKFIYTLKQNRFENILFGTLGKVVKLLITKINFGRVILFDDGLETIYTAELLYSKPTLSRYQYSYLGLNRQFKNEFIYFTILKHQNKDIQVIKNNMTFVGTKKRQLVNDKLIAFIGQDFVRTGYVNEKDYYDVLTLVAKKYHDYTIEYFPHRGENDIDINNISKVFPNFNIMRIETTFEIYLSRNEYLPKKIISCWSTVLIVMKDMFKEIELESIMISKNKLLKNKNKIMDTYDYFKKHDINVIYID